MSGSPPQMETIGALHSAAEAEAVLQAHHVLEIGGILADPPAAGAGEVAGVQRLQLQHQGKSWSALDSVFNDVRGDFRRQRQWESHN